MNTLVDVPVVTVHEAGSDGLLVAEVSNLTDPGGSEWHRIARMREQAEGALKQQEPTARIISAATSSHNSYVFWFTR